MRKKRQVSNINGMRWQGEQRVLEFVSKLQLLRGLSIAGMTVDAWKRRSSCRSRWSAHSAPLALFEVAYDSSALFHNCSGAPKDVKTSPSNRRADEEPRTESSWASRSSCEALLVQCMSLLLGVLSSSDMGLLQQVRDWAACIGRMLVVNHHLKSEKFVICHGVSARFLKPVMQQPRISNSIAICT